jgi:hypothetical protein
VLDTNGNYVLVDYDLLSVVNEKGRVSGISGLNPHSHAPTIMEEHGSEVDFWGLGYLMSTIVVSPQVSQATVRLFGTEVITQSMKQDDLQILFLSITAFCESL